jgi:hypothetical protein
LPKGFKSPVYNKYIIDFMIRTGYAAKDIKGTYRKP